ncbi:DUF6123 family protein [Gracilibacillus kekensis]|uniref:Uncharacterized protein n=1 Tax=Gracilibacillus kekensis TaxID=1027249 RepID=A0A1M7PPE5_9BACI|nr:DUF6123 family protein [Gracilibacillus kekensis]SHN19036.1 hypothetical protein SAMN05216179_2390 [Gracilibacillus kekensis]
MKDSEILAHFLEKLWSKGFKLTDEEVHFIYFGQKYTNTSVDHVELALLYTLQLQMTFDRSFYISLLELFARHNVKNRKQAILILKQNDLMD